MKTKFCAFFIILLIFCTSLGAITVSAKNVTVDDAENIIDGIVDFKRNGKTVQEWINGELTDEAGSSEWYILSLAQSGEYDFSSYRKALCKYLEENKVSSNVSRQKYALSLIAVGGTESYISSTLNDTIGKQGIMSWIFGLHILNNGYKSTAYTPEEVKDKLLSMQQKDGGWAVISNLSDVDATAMTIQALAPYYNSDSAVKAAVDSGLIFLSERQLENGEFGSYGVANAESTAQVLLALSSLGIDAASDERFIKNGNTVFDGIKKFSLSSGGFCHKEGGEYNDLATVQVLYSMVSYMRFTEGKQGFYILDRRNPSKVEPAPAETSSDVSSPISSSTQSGNIISSSDIFVSSRTYTSSDTSQTSVTSSNITASTESDVSYTEKTNETVGSADTEKNDTSVEYKKFFGGYKPIACICVIIVGGAVCAVLYVLEKRNVKNFIVVGIICVSAVLFIIFTDFQTAKNYYGKTSDKANTVGTVEFSVRCDTLIGKADSEYIPSDGIILDSITLEIESDTTVYDVLVDAVRENGIQMDSGGADGMMYVSGINYLYEFDYGDLSGWMYRVNGEIPSVSCDEYTLSDGDIVEWLYTCDLGNDLQ